MIKKIKVIYNKRTFLLEKESNNGIFYNLLGAIKVKIKNKIIVILFLASFLIPSSTTTILKTAIQPVSGPPSMELIQKWNYTTSGTYISGTPTLFDLYQDGMMEIIYGTGNQGLLCLDEEGNLNWSYNINSVVRESPAVVDVDGDYKPNIVFGVSDRLRFLDYDGTYMRYTGTGYILGAPTIVDFEDDGEWEFLVPSQTFSNGIYCINSNGTIRWTYTAVSNKIYHAPTACDLDNDGVYEIIFGSFDGKIYCINETGHFQWDAILGGQVWSTPSIGDVDNNGDYEIIVGSVAGVVYCFDDDGSIKWLNDVAHPIYTSAVLGDLDNDGDLEAYVGVNGESGISTPALHRFDGATGTIDWYYNVTDGFFRSPAIADVDGDTQEEIVMVSDDGVVRVLTESGVLDESMTYAMDGNAACSPVIADVDNDGYMDIFVGDINGVMYCLNVEYASSNFALTRWHTLSGSMFRTGHPDEDGDYIDNQKEEELGLTPTNVDTDNDQLDEGRELIFYHTDPLEGDTDSDLLGDGYEVDTYNTNPNDADTDDDGIDDYEEVYAGIDGYETNPTDADTDDDTIIDGDEIIEGTDPTEPDSDFDGLDDRQELDRGTDPWDTDSDDDLLTDGDEVWVYGSNPSLEDTDSDGLDDWEEVNLGADGLLTSVDDDDSDDDGILDGEEAGYGTSPLDGDTDDDSILDGEEIIAGVDGFVTDPLEADTDGDGYNDDIEIAEGTDPTDPDDYPIEETPTPTPTQTLTPTNTTTEKGAFIGGFVSFAIVLTTALSVIVLIERRRKYLN